MKLVARTGAAPVGAAVAGIMAALTLAVGLLHLDHLGFTFCAFKALTGLPCGTCGTTRALGRVFHGDLSGAFAMNPLVMLAASALLAWAVSDLAFLGRHRSLRLQASGVEWRWLGAGAAVAFLLNWAYLISAGR